MGVYNNEQNENLSKKLKRNICEIWIRKRLITLICKWFLKTNKKIRKIKIESKKKMNKWDKNKNHKRRNTRLKTRFFFQCLNPASNKRKKFFNVYSWERDRHSVSGEGQREGGRHRIPRKLQALSWHLRSLCRVQTHRLRDHDLSQSRTLNQLSHPGAHNKRKFLKDADLVYQIRRCFFKW